jgi:hypothetical protein
MANLGGHEDWYEHASEYWESIDETHFLTPDETEEIYPVFLDFLSDTNMGISPDSSLAFADLLNYFGWDYDTFDWDDFRDWYDSV